jgi:hypothetical protein
MAAKMQTAYLYELKSVARYSIIRVIIKVQKMGWKCRVILTGKKKDVYEVVDEKGVDFLEDLDIDGTIIYM